MEDCKSNVYSKKQIFDNLNITDKIFDNIKNYLEIKPCGNEGMKQFYSQEDYDKIENFMKETYTKNFFVKLTYSNKFKKEGFVGVQECCRTFNVDRKVFDVYCEKFNIELIKENNTTYISKESKKWFEKLFSSYNKDDIRAMLLSEIKPFSCEGITYLTLRKELNLTLKQFKNKISHVGLELKSNYTKDEENKIREFCSNGMNKAELREIDYVNRGWIPLRNVLNNLGKKYKFSKNTGMNIIDELNIDVYKPNHQYAFLNKEQYNKIEIFLNKFDNEKERRLFFQKQTVREKYNENVDNPSQLIQSKNKISVANKLNSKERLEKSKKTNLEKYGVENIFQTKELIKSNRLRIQNNYNKIKNINGITIKELIDIFDKDSTTMTKLISKLNIKKEHNNIFYINYSDLKILESYFDETKFHNVSHLEKEVVEFIKSICDYEIIENNKKIINPLELDIYIPNKNLAIEFDGLYWHCEVNKDKYYHLNKTKKCNDKGIDLIHIFEDDWNDKKEIIKSMIASRLGIYKEKIFARKCDVVEITSILDIKNFFNKNHLQGYARCNRYFALKYNDEILQMIAITNKGWHDGNTELTRFATKLNTQVVGGFSKLIKYVSDIYKCSIVSYINRSYFNGKGYDSCGFKIIKENPPNYTYLVNQKRVNKVNFRKNKIKKLYDNGVLTYWNENETEHELTYKNGLYRIYDCGTIKVVYKK